VVFDLLSWLPTDVSPFSPPCPSRPLYTSSQILRGDSSRSAWGPRGPECQRDQGPHRSRSDLVICGIDWSTRIRMSGILALSPESRDESRAISRAEFERPITRAGKSSGRGAKAREFPARHVRLAGPAIRRRHRV
jgi:hypothetical protein